MAEIKEECGVFGIYDLDGNDVTSSIYYGLTSLQHKGAEMGTDPERSGFSHHHRFRGDRIPCSKRTSTYQLCRRSSLKYSQEAARSIWACDHESP